MIILEIKVNDYVRTKEGYICKILKLNEPRYDDGYLDFNDIDSPRIYKPNVVKSSPNIIDLIEVGDYVNGQLVKHIAYFEGVEEPIKKLIFADEYHLIPTEVCEKNEIKSIVTKEIFEQMEYKIN